MKLEIPPWRKILITVDEAAALASVGRRVIDKWAKDYNFPSFKDGEGERGNRKINRVLFEEYLANRAKMRVGER